MRSDNRTIATARRLRREMTPPEVRLRLRLRQPGDGLPRVRRQHPLGPYVLDFYCPVAKLCVEIDGWGHDTGEQALRDRRRATWLAAQGIAGFRITAADVLADPDGVVDGIVRTAAEQA